MSKVTKKGRTARRLGRAAMFAALRGAATQVGAAAAGAVAWWLSHR
jgi:hypothetical protein